MDNHTYIIRDSRRLAALHETGLLDSPPEEAFDRLTRLAAAVLNTPVSLITLVDADRQFFKSVLGLGEPWASRRESPLSHSFCQYTVSDREPFIVQDAHTNARVQASPAVTEMDVVAYAGVPLILSSGQALGALCVIEPEPRAWTDREIALLRELAAMVVTNIELRLEVRQRERMELLLNRQIDFLTTLFQMGRELARHLDLNSVLAIGLDAAVRLSQAQAAYVALLDGRETPHLELIGLYDWAQVYASLLPDAASPARRALDGKMFVMTDRDDPAYVPATPQMQHCLVLPLLTGGRIMGVLQLETTAAAGFDPAVVDLLMLLTSLLAAACDNARLYAVARDRLTELQATNERLRELEHLKTQMIRMAAHDIRNPLAALVSSIEITQMRRARGIDLDPDHLLATVEEASAQIQRITDEILSLKRVENLAAQRLEPVDLHAVVGAMLAEQQRAVARAGLTLTTSLPAEPVWVEGDTAYLREAMTNLLSNAIKYTPAGGAIQVELSLNDAGAHFCVRDTGIGIPPEQQSQLFQPFFRVKRAELSHVEGFGLGLYLAKQVVERCNGTMHFTSEPGQGSTFGFELPRLTHEESHV